jgi:Fe-S-cluster-containing hydrogenase component 2
LIKEEGRVRFVEENCIGCKMCMLACPFGVISYDSHKGKIFKCDTCDGDPECVRFCPTGALEYKESELAAVARQRDFAKKVAETSE